MPISYLPGVADRYTFWPTRCEKLLPLERPVVHGARQPETVLDERALARSIPLVHRADLRNRDVRLVDHDEKVFGEVVEQAVRSLAGRAAVDVPRVVLDAVAEADLLHHLDVEGRAHAQSLRLEKLALTIEFGEALGELGLDRADRAVNRLLTRGVVRAGEHRDGVHRSHDVAGERMQGIDRLDLVAEHLDADRELLVHGNDLDRVAPHPEVPREKSTSLRLYCMETNLRMSVSRSMRWPT